MTILTLGVADFAKVRQFGNPYADKTRLLYDLVTTSGSFFLSRPRRFGKSLLVSTLEAILLGQRELFKGLWIDGSDYNWTPYPVINLAMNNMLSDSVDALNRSISLALGRIAKNEGLTLQDPHPVNAFVGLIDDLQIKYNQNVAVLIDEYDSPILEHVVDPERAEEFRKTLAKFYGVLKGVEKQRGFIFITGVSKFAKASIFSALNNLDDLTLDRKYADICGFTLEEFDSLFAGALEDGLEEFKSDGYLPEEATVADLRESILALYDGHSWDGKTRVLNPWSIIACLKKNDLENHWSETGSPTFLVDLIRKKKVDLGYYRQSHSIIKRLNVMDVKNLEPTPIMFQAGYLTVKSRHGSELALDFPNLEVRASFIPLLMSMNEALLGRPIEMAIQAKAMLAALRTHDAVGLAEAFGSFLANIPFGLHISEEAFYHNAFFMAMILAEQEVDMETPSGDGRPDVVVAFEDSSEVFVVELKYRKTTRGLKGAVAKAMTQIEETKYDKKFRGAYKTIYKTALAVGHRVDVMAAIEIAPNWRLVKTRKGYAVKITESDRVRDQPLERPKPPETPKAPKRPKM
jgi:hypothetical protein